MKLKRQLCRQECYQEDTGPVGLGTIGLARKMDSVRYLDAQILQGLYSTLPRVNAPACLQLQPRPSTTGVPFWPSTPSFIILYILITDQMEFLSFLVDPTTYPNAISLAQANKDIDVMDKLCYLTRTWLFAIHKERLILLDLWNKKWPNIKIMLHIVIEY